ncbi:hypothetical protein DFJ74DRAFT_344564 [Hyaloraphidium curvatum]|nr:hypothetical protein DFJ74DRAFT_344564 [Hyaloraphidium curvatum]
MSRDQDPERTDPIFAFCPDSMESAGRAAIARCGVPSAKLLTCGACRSVTYCQKACQTAAWREHKLACPILRHLLDFAGAAVAQPLSATPNGTDVACPQIQLRDDHGPEGTVSLWLHNHKLGESEKERNTAVLFLSSPVPDVVGLLEISYQTVINERKYNFVDCSSLKENDARSVLLRNLHLDASRGLVGVRIVSGDLGWTAFPGLDFTTNTSEPRRGKRCSARKCAKHECGHVHRAMTAAALLQDDALTAVIISALPIPAAKEDGSSSSRYLVRPGSSPSHGYLFPDGSNRASTALPGLRLFALPGDPVVSFLFLKASEGNVFKLPRGEILVLDVNIGTGVFRALVSSGWVLRRLNPGWTAFAAGFGTVPELKGKRNECGWMDGTRDGWDAMWRAHG